MYDFIGVMKIFQVKLHYVYNYPYSKYSNLTFDKLNVMWNKVMKIFPSLLSMNCKEDSSTMNSS
jgi:hypothetical protein